MKRNIAVSVCSIAIIMIASAAWADYWVVKDSQGKCKVVSSKGSPAGKIEGPFKHKAEALKAKVKECPPQRRTATEYWVVRDEPGKCNVVQAKEAPTSSIEGPFKTKAKAEKARKRLCPSETNER